MKPKEFSDAIREYNKQYRALFEYIPSIRDYSCTQEEYVAALKRSISEKQEISHFLVRYGYPLPNESDV